MLAAKQKRLSNGIVGEGEPCEYIIFAKFRSSSGKVLLTKLFLFINHVSS